MLYVFQTMSYILIRNPLLRGDVVPCLLAPLGGQLATVEVDVDRVEEGQQTQQCQDHVHLRERNMMYQYLPPGGLFCLKHRS